MTIRRAMTAQDWAVTAMGVGGGFIVGLVIGALLWLLVDGLWVLLLFAVPFLLLQLLFEAGTRGLWAGGRRLLGLPRREEPPEPEPDLTIPRLRAWSFAIGFGAGILAAMIQRFRMGDLLA